MTDIESLIVKNLTNIRGRITDAARRAGRDPAAIRLVAVTKNAPAMALRALVAAGCNLLGESRPQELWVKAADLEGPPIAWHLIGPLQRNKVRRTLPIVALIHSVDSPRLLATIDREAAALGRRSEVLLEVNISGESAKHGLSPVEAEPMIVAAAGFAHVSIRGLMGVASLGDDPAVPRRQFAELRRLRDQLAGVAPPNAPLAELSMGMSSDFEAAILEGATLVRIGSALFAGIDSTP